MLAQDSEHPQWDHVRSSRCQTICDVAASARPCHGLWSRHRSRQHLIRSVPDKSTAVPGPRVHIAHRHRRTARRKVLKRKSKLRNLRKRHFAGRQTVRRHIKPPKSEHIDKSPILPANKLLEVIELVERQALINQHKLHIKFPTIPRSDFPLPARVEVRAAGEREARESVAEVALHVAELEAGFVVDWVVGHAVGEHVGGDLELDWVEVLEEGLRFGVALFVGAQDLRVAGEVLEFLVVHLSILLVFWEGSVVVQCGRVEDGRQHGMNDRGILKKWCDFQMKTLYVFTS
jgi:hypothetical protein